jgi:hypothetical protein
MRSCAPRMSRSRDRDAYAGSWRRALTLSSAGACSCRRLQSSMLASIICVIKIQLDAVYA